MFPDYNKNNLLHDENKLQLYTLENMVIFFCFRKTESIKQLKPIIETPKIL